MDIFSQYPWLLSATLLAIGIGIGLVLEYVALPIAISITKKTSWQLDDAVLGSLRGLLVLWLTCAGAHFAAHSMPLKGNMAVDGVSALKIVGTTDSILLVIFIASLTIYAMRVAVAALALYGTTSGNGAPGVSLFTNITKVAILIMGILVILGTFDYDIRPILTALGVGGLAVALALQDTLSNLFAGLHVVASRQIKPGDYVKLDSGDEGYIADITWRNTTIKALPNNMVIVPNSKLASAIITNFYQPTREMGMGLNICVSFDSDLDKVEKVTLETATQVLARVPGVVEDTAVAVRFGGFGEYGVNLAVGFRVKEFTDQYMVKHELAKALHARYQAENIEIASAIVRKSQI
ncbi:MAG: hypothetical protein A2Y07_08500 [Planctomycetes bacterium GWF2_50_10]|nr:MAG: hypothetical protein A2Y07_08500 [Planctomycetes bacterium GWF2_50_10]